MNSVKGLMAAIAVVAIGLGSVQNATAGGLIGGIVDKVIPGAGEAMDSWSAEWQKRDSDASVMSQVLKGRPEDVPFRAAPGAGPAQPGQGQQFYGPPPPPPEQQFGGQYGGGDYPPPPPEPVYRAPAYYGAPGMYPPPPAYYPAPGYYRPAPVFAGNVYGPRPMPLRPMYGRY
jgi:hypothetical protein